MFQHVLSQGLKTFIDTSVDDTTKMEDNNELVFASFNQDTTSLAVGTTSGYKLYSLTSTDSLEPIYSNGKIIEKAWKLQTHFQVKFWFWIGTEDVYIAERLFSSSLVAIVSQSAPRKLKVCHFKKGTEICNYSYTSKILAVKMNRAVSFINSAIFQCHLLWIHVSEIGCMFGRVFIHSQHSGHESASYDSRNPSK